MNMKRFFAEELCNVCVCLKAKLVFLTQVRFGVFLLDFFFFASSFCIYLFAVEFKINE